MPTDFIAQSATLIVFIFIIAVVLLLRFVFHIFGWASLAESSSDSPESKRARRIGTWIMKSQFILLLVGAMLLITYTLFNMSSVIDGFIIIACITYVGYFVYNNYRVLFLSVPDDADDAAGVDYLTDYIAVDVEYVNFLWLHAVALVLFAVFFWLKYVSVKKR
jgi:hypothetical protein